MSDEAAEPGRYQVKLPAEAPAGSMTVTAGVRVGDTILSEWKTMGVNTDIVEITGGNSCAVVETLAGYMAVVVRKEDA